MKKNLFTYALTLGLFILLSGCGSSDNKAGNDASPSDENVSTSTESIPVIHKYGVKSGIVTFENSGFGVTLKKVLYFDDWGTREAEETYDENGILKETNLCDGKNMYILIHKDKTAYKRGECYRGVAYKFDWNEASRGGDEYKPTKLGNLNIAGKDCESFSLDISGSKTIYAGWNNICFLIETPAGNGKVINKAASIEENVSIPEDKLKVPADYTLN